MTERLDVVDHSQGFGGRVGGGKRPALLVVDLSRAFTESGYRCSCRNDDAFSNVLRVLDGFRAARRPVLFTIIQFATDDGRESGHLVKKMPALTELVAGSTACDLDPRLDRREGELVVTKEYTSSFFGTPVLSILVAARVDTVVVVGASTSGCVRATVVDAVQYGFRVLVPADAVADRAPEPHAAALYDIDAKYGDVMTTDDLLSYVASLSPRTRTSAARR